MNSELKLGDVQSKTKMMSALESIKKKNGDRRDINVIREHRKAHLLILEVCGLTVSSSSFVVKTSRGIVEREKFEEVFE